MAQIAEAPEKAWEQIAEDLRPDLEVAQIAHVTKSWRSQQV